MDSNTFTSTKGNMDKVYLKKKKNWLLFPYTRKLLNYLDKKVYC